MREKLWIGFVISVVGLACFSIFSVINAGSAIAQSARETACQAHKEAKRFLWEEKFLGQAGGDPRQAAILICTGKYGQALDPKCIAQEEKILRQQVSQVEAAIAKDCR